MVWDSLGLKPPALVVVALGIGPLRTVQYLKAREKLGFVFVSSWHPSPPPPTFILSGAFPPSEDCSLV